jgi:hypothetical protein
MREQRGDRRIRFEGGDPRGRIPPLVEQRGESEFGATVEDAWRRVRRLIMERLEVRTMLATFSVTNTDDSGPGSLRQAIIADGCIISDAHIERSVIGVRSVIQTGATIRNSIVMGADYYETDPATVPRGVPPIGVGRNCVIDRAIIDKNARIADGVVITPEGKPNDFDAANYFIRDGIVVVPKNAVIPRVLDLARLEVVSHGSTGRCSPIFPACSKAGQIPFRAGGDELRLLLGGAGSQGQPSANEEREVDRSEKTGITNLDQHISQHLQAAPGRRAPGCWL